MPSIDNRIVAMHFENAKFEAGVAKTMATLNKLNQALKQTGTTTGLSNIEKEANKVNFSGISGALDKLKLKLGFDGSKSFSDMESAANKISFNPLSVAIDGVKSGLSRFTSVAASGLDFLRTKISGLGGDKGLSDITASANRVDLSHIAKEADSAQKHIADINRNAPFSQIEGSANKISFGGLSSAVDSVTAKFSVLHAAAAVALGNITSRAVQSGTAFAKSF
ncbi:MAG TPA: hypothetical protein VN843_16810, partial [Anaerolineales bacterium]|nr:hypothetical protein [Anaerolineales bacterium]